MKASNPGRGSRKTSGRRPDERSEQPGRWAPWGEPNRDPRKPLPAIVIRLEIEAEEGLVWLESHSAEDETALVRWLRSRPRSVAELADDVQEILAELDDFPAAA